MYKDRKRDQGTKFIHHPLEVVNILQNEFNIEMNDDYIVIALLHDALWIDFEITKQNIINEFGNEIYKKIEKFTKPHILEQREKRVDDNKKFIETISEFNDEMLYIKLADRLNNLREVKFSNEEKKQRFIKETNDLYVELIRQRKNKKVFKNIYNIYMNEKILDERNNI